METKSFDKDYAKYYDFFNLEKDYGIEINFLKEVFEKYSTNVKNILDLGCGTGKHDELLISKGFNVFGLDLSKEMIEIAKSKNLENSEFEVGNMSNFSLNKKFDACISMFAAFGYQLKNSEIESSLNCIKNHLNDEGLLVLEVWNGLGVLRELPSSRENIFKKDNIKIVRKSFPELDTFNHKVDVNFKVKVFENNNLKEEYEEMHKMRFFFPQELIRYVENAGFKVLEICDTFKLGSKVNENNWNMVLIAKLKE